MTTYREAIERGLTQADADRYLEQLIEQCMEHLAWTDRGRAGELVRENLGYAAGYYDHATRERVERLYCGVHPIFGSIANGPPDPGRAFAAGKELAEAQKEGRPIEECIRRAAVVAQGLAAIVRPRKRAIRFTDEEEMP